MTYHLMKHLTRLLILTACAVPLVDSAPAQIAGERIPELENVGIEQHLEAELPFDARFTDQSGRRVSIGAAFGDEIPVILTLNYVDCPQLCSMQLTQLAEAMGAMKLVLGEDYRVVTVSIDPNDTAGRMLPLRDRYVDEYLSYARDNGFERDDETARDGWWMLSGEKEDIDLVAETVGFGYRWLPDKSEYAHAATNILCSPKGVVTQYLPGLSLEMAQTLRLGLVDASDGKIGTLYDMVFLNCFIFDSTTGQYSLAAFRLLRAAAVLTVLAVITGVFFMKRTGDQRVKPAAGANEEAH